jgi:hypothetical protein
MSNNPFSFEYGEEEEEKKPEPSVKKKVVKHHPIPVKKVEKVEDKTTPLPLDDTPVSIPEVITPIIPDPTPPVALPVASTIVSVSPSKEVEKPFLDSNTAVVGAIAVAATAAVVAGPSALAKLKSLRGKGKSVKSNQSKQNSQRQEEQRKQEEKKKEEQTACDAKSQEVQSLIDETNKTFDDLERNFLNFVGLEEDKELSQSISNLKKEMNKLKKTIKDLE